MAKLYIDAVYRGQNVEKGLQKTRSELNMVKDAARAAFGAFSVGLVLNELKKLEVGLMEDRLATARLETQLRRLGETRYTIAEIKNEIGGLRDALGAGDTELTIAYSRLIAMTGDAKTATEDITLALNMEAEGISDLNGALRLIAQARSGEYMTLRRSIPQLRTAIEQYTAMGDSIDVTEKVMQKLRETFEGTAAALAETDMGGFKRFSTALGELAEEALRFRDFSSTGSTEGKTFWGRLADHLNESRKYAQAFVTTWNALDLAIFNRLPPFLQDLRRGVNDVFSLGGAFPGLPFLRPPQRNQYEDDIAPPPVVIPPRPGGIGTPEIGTGLGFGDITGGIDADIRRRAEQWKEMIPQLIVPEGMQAWAQATSEGIETGMEEVDWSSLNQQAAALQDVFLGAFQAARGGVDQLANYMRERLINQVLTEFAKKLAMAFTFGGIGLGAGAAPFGVPGGQIGPATPPGFGYQMARAMHTNTAWRQYRG